MQANLVPSGSFANKGRHTVFWSVSSPGFATKGVAARRQILAFLVLWLVLAWRFLSLQRPSQVRDFRRRGRETDPIAF